MQKAKFKLIASAPYGGIENDLVDTIKFYRVERGLTSFGPLTKVQKSGWLVATVTPSNVTPSNVATKSKFYTTECEAYTEFLQLTDTPRLIHIVTESKADAGLIPTSSMTLARFEGLNSLLQSGMITIVTNDDGSVIGWTLTEKGKRHEIQG